MDHSPRFLEAVVASKKHIKEIDVDHVAQMLTNNDKFVLVDVREDSEVGS